MSIRTSAGDASYVRCVSESISVAFGGDELAATTTSEPLPVPGRGGSRHGSRRRVTEKCLHDFDVVPRPAPWPVGSRTGELAQNTSFSPLRRGKSEPADPGTVPQNSGPQFTEVPHVTLVPQPPKPPPTRQYSRSRGDNLHHGGLERRDPPAGRAGRCRPCRSPHHPTLRPRAPQPRSPSNLRPGRTSQTACGERTVSKPLATRRSTRSSWRYKPGPHQLEKGHYPAVRPRHADLPHADLNGSISAGTTSEESWIPSTPVTC